MVSILHNLLSEMHIRVYDAWHMILNARLLCLGRWWGRFGRTSRWQEGQAISSFEEYSVYIDVLTKMSRLYWLCSGIILIIAVIFRHALGTTTVRERSNNKRTGTVSQTFRNTFLYDPYFRSYIYRCITQSSV